MAGMAESNEFGWQVHSAMEAWTGRADLKASILLALQGGVLFAVFTTTDLLGQAEETWPLAIAFAAVVALILAMTLTAAALVPALGSRRRLNREHRDHIVYFGHLRYWTPTDLASRLQGLAQPDEASMLAHQLIRLSRLNWRKHRLLQVSAALTVLVLTAFVVAGIGLLR